MLQSVARNWLAWQCTLITGTCHGVIALGLPDQGPYRPTACWPEGSDPSVALFEDRQGRHQQAQGRGCRIKIVKPR